MKVKKNMARARDPNYEGGSRAVKAESVCQEG